MQSKKCVHRGAIALVLVTGLLAGCAPSPVEVPEESSLREGAQALSLSEPSLLRDINPRGLGAKPDQFVVANGTLFFVGSAKELWKSDGTEAGTVRVRGFESGNIQRLMAVGERVFFFQDSVLWTSDGTEAGTESLGNSLYSHAVLSMVGLGGRLFLFTQDAIWVSDGTKAGTVRLKSITIDRIFHPYRVVSHQGMLFFSAVTPGGGMGLWRSDGTEAGTVPIQSVAANASGAPSSDLVVSNGALYFTAHASAERGSLWKSDGTAEGTVLVKEDLAHPRSLTAGNGRLLFFSGVPSQESFLWASDGTAAGTVSIASFTRAVEPMMAVGGGLLFSVRQGDASAELWWSGGTTGNTVRLQTVCSAPGVSSSATPLASVKGVAFISVRCGDGRELWKSDGTAAGTVRVKDGLLSFSQTGGDLNGTLFFSADDGASGPELWKSDGTAAGTVLVRDLVKGQAPSEPSSLVAVGTTVFFYAVDGNDRLGLWKSDGTAEGTVLVQNLLDTSSYSQRPTSLTAVNGQVFFTMPGNGLYRSDGTPDGTRFLRGFTFSSGAGSLSALTNLGGTLFFATQDGDSAELWKSDGTTDGTVLVTELSTQVNPRVSDAVVLNGKLLFIVGNYSRSAELWTSDGTAAGTRRVKTLFQAADSFFQGSVQWMVVAGGKLFFWSYEERPTLWQSDGTEAGTFKVLGIYEQVTPDALAWTKGTLLVLSEGGRKLWRVEGSQATLIKELFPLPTGGSLGSIFIGHIGHVRGTLHYSVYNVNQARWELWRTDGTAEGTQRVPHLELGSADWRMTGGSTAFVEAGNRLFFVRDGGQGREPWVLPYAPFLCPGSPHTADADDARGAQVPLPPVQRAADVDAALPITYSHDSGSHFPMGTTRVTLTATDPAYPASTCALDVVVEDQSPPTLQCPASLKVQPSGGSGAVVEYPAATATDKVSSAATLVEYSHPSGSSFLVGKTTVEVKATDEAGNSQTCSFTVEVLEPGLLSCGGCGASSPGQALWWLLALAPMVARRRARPRG